MTNEDEQIIMMAVLQFGSVWNAYLYKSNSSEREIIVYKKYLIQTGDFGI